MNKEDLVKEVSKKIRISQKLASEVINLTLETIEKAISKGKKVTLVGFGTFELRHRASRMGRNPQNGKEIHIPAKKVPTFAAGKKFKEMANS
jgi:DNA-binding protein HU-beta